MSAPFSWPTVTLDMRFLPVAGMAVDVARCCDDSTVAPRGPASRPLWTRVRPPSGSLADPGWFAGAHSSLAGRGGSLAVRGGSLEDPAGECGLADQPHAPALGGQRGPEPHRAVSAQVELTQPVRAVSRLDRRSASIARLVHLGPPVTRYLRLHGRAGDRSLAPG